MSRRVAFVPGTGSPTVPPVNAERTDDDPAGNSRSVRSEHADEAGAAPTTPGQRVTSRRGTGARRAGGATGADLPSTPTELPVVPTVAPPTTVLPAAALPTSSPAGEAPRGDESRGINMPTSELRGAVPRGPGTAAEPDARPGSVADARATGRPVPTNVYRARRPGVAILLVIPAVGVGILLVRALAISAFGDRFDLSGIVASVCALAGLPFLVAGVYGLVTGAAYGAEHYGFKVWARPPLAYLLVGLAFVLAAGVAIR